MRPLADGQNFISLARAVSYMLRVSGLEAASEYTNSENANLLHLQFFSVSPKLN